MRSFRDFMESALYDPSLGFYCTRQQTADFYTAPELHEAFGAVLADHLRALLGRVSHDKNTPLTLVEAGCGDGTLACQVARRLREVAPELSARLRFALVERTRRDLTTAVRRLSAFGFRPQAYTDVSNLPHFNGVLYSNELFDALPVHLLKAQSGEIYEVFVADNGEQTLAPLSCKELEFAAANLRGSLNEGECHAVSLEALRWLSCAAARINSGYVLTIDYGKKFAPQQPNHPRAFRDHKTGMDLTQDPHLQDLTASVDFQALVEMGDSIGLKQQSYSSLAQFLIENGIGNWLQGDASGSEISNYRERAKIKTLLHPDGMGEVFKVLLQIKQ